MRRPAARTVGIGVVYGALAGAVASLTFFLMTEVEHAVWDASDARWYIPVAIGVGGVLIAAIRRRAGTGGLDEQIEEAADPTSLRRRRTAAIGAVAIVAVGFGGAIGPEAGLLAMVAELSALVSCTWPGTTPRR